jgi:probable selenium-dependent hydroxylase accessory protein YqeC
VSLLAALGAEGGVVAIAGAGGKTSLLYRLAAEAQAEGRRVIVTSTTHMGAPADGAVVFEDGRERSDEVRAALAAHGRVLVLGQRLREDKCVGIAPERVDSLAALADLVLVEADGSRQRPFKTPAPHEPVVPQSTMLLVVVVGLEVLGQPLDEAHVHRLDLVAAAAGQPPGTSVTPETIARTLAHPGGYPVRVPPAARSAVFLNRVEDATREAAAFIAEHVVPPYDSAVAGRAREGVVLLQHGR